MTTPGGQLTPGDEPEIGDPPQFGVPSGAYVGDAGSPQSFKDLNTLNKDEAKRRMQQPLEGVFGRQVNAVALFTNALLGVVQGAVNLVVGTVQAVVDGIKGIFNAIGSLFGAARVDTAAVDAARVAGENAIVAKWGDALDKLDEIQRVGGAYGRWGMFNLTYGEDHPHPIPLTEPFGLMQGCFWHPPRLVWQYGHGETFADTDSARGNLARLGGTLELQESGLWMIYFQAALLQGTQRTNTPADLWCYVTSDQFSVPAGTPPESGTMPTYSRLNGAKIDRPVDRIAAHGRAGQYLGVADTRYGGGNTVSGYMLAPLSSAGWFVHMAGTGYRHFGGASSTMLFATKVNSKSLRDSIEALKVQIAEALPGQPTDKLLDEGAIAAMVAEAGALEASEVVVPERGGGDG